MKTTQFLIYSRTYTTRNTLEHSHAAPRRHSLPSSRGRFSDVSLLTCEQHKILLHTCEYVDMCFLCDFRVKRMVINNLLLEVSNLKHSHHQDPTNGSHYIIIYNSTGIKLRWCQFTCNFEKKAYFNSNGN